MQTTARFIKTYWVVDSTAVHPHPISTERPFTSICLIYMGMYVYRAVYYISLVLFQVGVIMGITFAPDWLTGQRRRVLYKDQVSDI